MFRYIKRLSLRATSHLPPLPRFNLRREMSSRPSPTQSPAQNTPATTTTNPNFYSLPTPTSIRLLNIHTIIPATPETKEPTIFYTIHFFELATSPPFLALSYTWQSPVRSSLASTEDESPPSPTAASDQSVKTLLASYASNGGSASTPAPALKDMKFISERPYRGTKNLRDALVGLALAPGLELGGCWVWADAICIDQEDMKEKVVQVGMMGEIYERAEGVVVWLGPVQVPTTTVAAGDGDGEGATKSGGGGAGGNGGEGNGGHDGAAELESFLWLHNEFFDALGPWVERHGVDELGRCNPLDPGFTSQLGVSPPGGVGWMECWERYFTFYRRRRWFSRAWIVQEVALAKQVVVLCGDRVIEWRRMVAMGELLRSLGWQQVLGMDVNRGFGRAMGDEIIRLSAIKEKSLSLTATDTGATDDGDARRNWFSYFQSLLHDTRVFSAGDPRDKVFAILGIAKRGLPPGMTMPVMPDYSETATATSVFSTVTATLLQELPRLEALSLTQGRASKIEDLPSWVPDLTCNLTPVPLPFLRDAASRFECDPVPVEPNESVFRVSGGELHLRAAKIDHIVAVCTPMWDLIKTQQISDCLALCEGVSPEYMATHLDPGEVLWRTMCANTADGTIAAPELADSFRHWVSVRLATSLTPPIIKVDPTTREVTITPALDVDSIRARITAILNQVPELEETDATTTRPSLPSVDHVFGMCSTMHRFLLTNFMARYSQTLDPGDPLPTYEDQITQIEGLTVEFKNAIAPCIPFRRLYRTSDGFLGLGPVSAEVGDQIWMLRTGRVPFVLRGAGEPGQFRLVGETYLHGFMDGELQGTTRRRLEEVVIR